MLLYHINPVLMITHTGGKNTASCCGIRSIVTCTGSGTGCPSGYRTTIGN